MKINIEINDTNLTFSDIKSAIREIAREFSICSEPKQLYIDNKELLNWDEALVFSKNTNPYSIRSMFFYDWARKNIHVTRFTGLRVPLTHFYTKFIEETGIDSWSHKFFIKHLRSYCELKGFEFKIENIFTGFKTERILTIFL